MEDTTARTAGELPTFDRSFLPHPQIWPDQFELTDDHLSPRERLPSPFEPLEGEPADLKQMVQKMHECEVRARRLRVANAKYTSLANGRGRREDAAAFRVEAQRLHKRVMALVVELVLAQQESISRITDLLEAAGDDAHEAEELPDDGDPWDDDLGDAAANGGQA